MRVLGSSMKSLAAALVLRVVAVAATTNTDAVQPKYPVNGTVTPCYQNASLSKLPLCNPGLNPMTRAKDLVSRMTKSEFSFRTVEKIACHG